jgi:hypothetical protein
VADSACVLFCGDVFSVCARLTQQQIGRPKEPERKPLKEGVKHNRCRGCNKLGHNLKSCVEVDLDMVYAKLTRGRNDSDVHAVGGADSSASSSDGEIEDEDVPVAIIPVVPERKRSRSHELTVAALEAAEGVTGRGARQRK